MNFKAKNEVMLLGSLVCAFFVLLMLSFTFLIAENFVVTLFLVIINFYLCISFTSFAILRTTWSQKCNGTDLVEGCGKVLRPFTLIEFYKRFPKHPKSDKWYIGYHLGLSTSEYERKYCCKQCLDQHEAVKIANILTADPPMTFDEAYFNVQYPSSTSYYDSSYSSGYSSHSSY